MRTNSSKATQETPSDQLVGRRFVADRWDVSVETIKRKERSKVLKPLKLGSTIRFRLSDIIAVEEQAQAAAI